jgi:DNA-directed RNA polymerase, delta subunit
MSTQSMTDIAYGVLESTNEAMSFKDLWEHVNNAIQFEPSVAAKKISLFYTNLSLDGRFVALKDNRWELKERLKFEESHIDTSAIEIDDSDLDDDFIDDFDKEDDLFVSDEY